jgi:hypothetical protein
VTAGGARPLDPRAERRHPASGGPWSELYGWDLAPGAGRPGVAIRVVLHRDRAWYLTGVVGADPALTVVSEVDVPAPSGPESLELRASGLWADHHVETPFAHVSVGLEAFGVALDGAGEALRGGFGIRTPVGYDLEWEDAAGPLAGSPTGEGYGAVGRAHGEILLGRGRYEVEGPGARHHAWGALDWWGAGWWRLWLGNAMGNHLVAHAAAGEGKRNQTVADGHPPRAGLVVLADLVGADASDASDRSGAAAGSEGAAALDVDLDGDGLPAGARLAPETGPPLDLVPTGCVAAALPDPHGGRGSVLALTAVRTPDAAGWLETVAPAR